MSWIISIVLAFLALCLINVVRALLTRPKPLIDRSDLLSGIMIEHAEDSAANQARFNQIMTGDLSSVPRSGSTPDWQQALVDHVFTHPPTLDVLNEHAASKEEVHELIGKLCVAGCDQMVASGHNVMISTIFFHHSLDYALAHAHADGPEFMGHVLRLIDYYEKDKIGPIA